MLGKESAQLADNAVGYRRRQNSRSPMLTNNRHDDPQSIDQLVQFPCELACWHAVPLLDGSLGFLYF
jgi:hypothetical protein